MVRRSLLAALFLGTMICCYSPATALAAEERKAPAVEAYLTSGKLADGEGELTKQLAADPKNDEARFGLGMLQFLQAVEHLAQSLYHYGLQDAARNSPVPIVRLPLPENPQPNKIGYTDLRKVLQTLIDDLTKAEATLAQVQSADVKLPIHFGQIRLDLDHDGLANDDEALWKIFVRMNRGAEVIRADAEQFLIVFDKADSTWLQGYCNLLMAMCESALAHDGKELFERTGHLFFKRVESPYPFLAQGRRAFDFGGVDVADVIAFIHLINLPVTEPERMKSALAHLEKVITLSRQNWRELLAETDDDREWIPNPKQTGVIPNARVNQQMVSGWDEFLAEADALLAGKKLIPFWRSAAPEGHAPEGVNLRRVFTEPKTFDLVLWMQGTGAAPFLEKGPLSTPDVWQRLNRLFNGEFVGFALWFN